ncbi:MAG: transaldolase family protein [Chloroflexota bacterium]
MDNLTRQIVRGSELKQLIEEDGLRGMTSNPTIFQKAIVGSTDYDEQLKTLVHDKKSAAGSFEAIAVQDVQDACDVFRPVYDALDGRDGFVSIEVSPGQAHNVEGSVTEAERLWKAVNRPNGMKSYLRCAIWLMLLTRPVKHWFLYRVDYSGGRFPMLALWVSAPFLNSDHDKANLFISYIETQSAEYF